MNLYKIFRTLIMTILITTSALAMMEDPDAPKHQSTLKPMPEYLPKEISPEDVTYTIIPPQHQV